MIDVIGFKGKYLAEEMSGAIKDVVRRNENHAYAFSHSTGTAAGHLARDGSPTRQNDRSGL